MTWSKDCAKRNIEQSRCFERKVYAFVSKVGMLYYTKSSAMIEVQSRRCTKGTYHKEDQTCILKESIIECLEETNVKILGLLKK